MLIIGNFDAFQLIDLVTSNVFNGVCNFMFPLTFRVGASIQVTIYKPSRSQASTPRPATTPLAMTAVSR